MTQGPRIRAATTDDAAAIAAIYAPYVTGTAASFEIEPPTAAAMAERIDRVTRTHPWLLAEGDTVVGYAYAAPFHHRPALRPLGRGVGLRRRRRARSRNREGVARHGSQ